MARWVFALFVTFLIGSFAPAMAEEPTYLMRLGPPKSEQEREERWKVGVAWTRQAVQNLRTPAQVSAAKDFYGSACEAHQRYRMADGVYYGAYYGQGGWGALLIPSFEARTMRLQREIGLTFEQAYDVLKREGRAAGLALWRVLGEPIPERERHRCGIGRGSFTFSDTNRLAEELVLLREAYRFVHQDVRFPHQDLFRAIEADYRVHIALIRERMRTGAIRLSSGEAEIGVLARSAVHERGFSPSALGLAPGEVPTK